MEEQHTSPASADRDTTPRPDPPSSAQPRGPDQERVEKFSARPARQTLEPSASASSASSSSSSSSSSSQLRPPLPSSGQIPGLPPLDGTLMAASETQIDPVITARVLQMLRRHRPVMPLFPSLVPFMPASENDSDDVHAVEFLHADEDHDYQMEMDGEGGGRPASVMRIRGVWQLNSSADGAASQCQRIVRNVPRMRKRVRMKAEHQAKQAAGPDQGHGKLLAGYSEG